MNDRIWYFAGSAAGYVERGYCAITNSDARLEIFAASADGTLWWAFQNAQIDGGFAGNLSGWFSLGQPQPVEFFTPIAAGVNGDGRVEVFGFSLHPPTLSVVGFWHIAQVQPGATTVSGWGGWEQLPGPPVGGPLDPRPSVGSDPSLFVARNSDLTLEVFAFGSTAWHVRQSAPGVWSPEPQWQGLLTFDSVAGSPGPPAPLTRFAVVGRNLDGRLEAIAVGAETVWLYPADGAPTTASVIWHCSQLSVNDPGWTDWSIITEAPAIATVTSVATNRDGRLDVFFGAQAGGVFHMEQLSPNAMAGLAPAWSDVQVLAIPASTAGGTSLALPAVALNPYTGLLEAFVVGNDSALWHATQATPDPFGGWGNWESFGKPSDPSSGTAVVDLAKVYPLSLAVDAADRIWVFVRDLQSNLFFTPNRFTMPTPENISIEVTPHWNCGVAENYTITVLDSASRTPISGALVSLTSGDGTGQQQSKERHGTTNASGSIEFRDVVLKDWKVKIPHKRGAPDWVDNPPVLQVSARGYPTFTTAVACPPLTPDV